MVSMTGYWNAYKINIPMQLLLAMAMAIAMAMMGCERKPASMPPSQDEANTTVGDFTEITVSNSDNELHLIRVTSARLDGWMPDIP
jgi:predicted amidohydrolase